MEYLFCWWLSSIYCNGKNICDKESRISCKKGARRTSKTLMGFYGLYAQNVEAIQIKIKMSKLRPRCETEKFLELLVTINPSSTCDP